MGTRAPKQTPPPKLFAIVVGVSTYDNATLNLRYSSKDAIDFAHALELFYQPPRYEPGVHPTAVVARTGTRDTAWVAAPDCSATHRHVLDTTSLPSGISGP